MSRNKVKTENVQRKDNKRRLPKCLSLFVYLVPNHRKYVLGFILRFSLLFQSFFELLLISLDFFYRLFQAVNSWIRNNLSFFCSFSLLGFYLSFLQSFCLLSFNIFLFCFLSQFSCNSFFLYSSLL